MNQLSPICVCELTATGWRGLTADGEVIDVNGVDGKIVRPGASVLVYDAGVVIGEREVPPPTDDNLIETYLACSRSSIKLLRAGLTEQALQAADLAIKIMPTQQAKFNRAMILLQLGRWQEGFAEYGDCEASPPFMRPWSRRAVAAGLRPWRGDSLSGKRLLLIHDHGFGDTIMMLRYVSRLWQMGADVILLAPRELYPLALHCVDMTDTLPADVDYFCTMLGLLRWLRVEPAGIPTTPYLYPHHLLRAKWKGRLDRTRRRIGLAWSVGHFINDDFPRSIPLAALVDHFDGADVDLYSVQQQGADEAILYGVEAYEFADFADCAAFMLNLDQIISIDTAALHLAGAIGHPDVVGLLSHWHSWRWQAPLYDNVRLCVQPIADDWLSALEQL
jgi:hypothetical protein